jgi:hypothetical protein
MSRVIGSLLILLTLSAGIYSAHAFGLGEGNRFGRLGFFKKNGASGPPPVTCASTGVFDLSNVCNDIYFIGALK